MTIPAATSDSNYDAATDDPKQARSQLSALQQAYEQTRSFAGGAMGSLTATDAGTLDVDSVDAGTIYVAAQAGSPSPVVSDLGAPTRGAPWKLLVFEGGITLTHGAGTLELPGGANILTEDNDSAVVVYDIVGSPAFWRVISYTRAALAPNALGWTHIQTQVAAADTAVDFALPAGYRTFRLTMDMTVSSSTEIAIRTSTDGGSSFAATGTSYWQGSSFPATTTTNGFAHNEQSGQMRACLAPFSTIAVGVVTHIFGARDSSYWTTCMSTASADRNAVARGPSFFTGMRAATEDNDAIRIVKMSSGNFTGNLTLEGLKIT